MVMGQQYLLLVAMFSLLFTMVKTNGDYVLAHVVEEGAKAAVAAGAIRPNGVQDYIGGVFASYSFWVDMISLVIQAFVVSRVVKHLGLGFAFLVLPLIALTDGVVMAAWPLLAAVTVGKTAESAVDYSFNNTVRNVLWLPTSRRAKYLAKQASDTFFVRAGDVSSAALVFFGVHQLGMPVRAIAIVNVMLVSVWFLLARAILKEHARLARGEHTNVKAGRAAQTMPARRTLAQFAQSDH
jgi:AAA family ATP:ADP antiporter